MPKSPLLILSIEQLLHELDVRADSRDAKRLISIINTELDPFRRIPNSCSFRDAVIDAAKILERPLVLVDKKVDFEIPPPFHEHFEPIRLGSQDPQKALVSGRELTLLEKSSRLGLVLSVPVASVMFFKMFEDLTSGLFFGTALTVAFIIAGVSKFRLRNRWFLVPQGVAIEETRSWNKKTVLVAGPTDTVAYFRFDDSREMLVLELWQSGFTVWSHHVSMMDARTFLAAWQSSHPTPSETLVREFLRY